MTTKSGIEGIIIEDIIEELQKNSLRSTRSLYKERKEALSAIRQLLLESLGKKKYLIDNLPLTKDEGYLDKCVQAKDMVDGYNTARQEDIDVINKLCGGER